MMARPDQGEVSAKPLRYSSPIVHASGSFNSCTLIRSNSSGVSSTITAGEGIPRLGTGPKYSGMIPDGAVSALNSMS